MDTPCRSLGLWVFKGSTCLMYFFLCVLHSTHSLPSSSLIPLVTWLIMSTLLPCILDF
ncbi:uncharacterized protein F4812DRAFT_423308 [Daldinia caldariorum]|uniref:uncharacterized protein n=1 Tax=Daldinia caldariorum TaxID=326644 RepID=UPI00200742F1|nr:uncharacterized protein F4812DRAFT_423308 [Daldinia caldariorum]KAI1469494.1 hypothetical protein F4812DRAFT_423308 [Daldinia caldariorum]